MRPRALGRGARRHPGHQSADELMLAAGGPVVTEPLEFDAMREFEWVSTVDVPTLVDLAATHGFVITASERDRADLLDAVRGLGERVADADGMVRLPYRLVVYRFILPRSAPRLATWAA